MDKLVCVEWLKIKHEQLGRFFKITTLATRTGDHAGECFGRGESYECGACTSRIDTDTM